MKESQFRDTYIVSGQFSISIYSLYHENVQKVLQRTGNTNESI